MSFLLEVKFKGGLGNQLFQYATARGLAIRQKTKYLLYNTESYQQDVAGRAFGLSNYRVQPSVKESGLSRRLFRKDTKANKLLSALPFYAAIEEKGLILHTMPARLPMLASISGYWQSEQYFKEIRAVLLEELQPVTKPALPGWQDGQPTVAVHIRRGDYLKESAFGPLKESYYHEAIALMKQRVGDAVFVFFSDDIPWCKTRFTDPAFVFCDEKDWEQDHLQLYLMSTCRHQIIANSSFSWWGAWLNNHPGRIVVRPVQPFADNSLMYESYYPQDWTPVDNRQ